MPSDELPEGSSIVFLLLAVDPVVPHAADEARLGPLFVHALASCYCGRVLGAFLGFEAFEEVA